MTKAEITVIDDERMLLMEVRRVLKSHVEEKLQRPVAVHAHETIAECRRRAETETSNGGVMRIAVLDLFLREPDNGFALMREALFRQRFHRVIALSRMDHLPIIRSILAQGLCDAYIGKTSGGLEQIVDAVVCLGQDQPYRNELMERAQACTERNAFDSLTRMEIDILRMTHLDQLHPKGIASELECQPKTVYSIRTRAYQKLGTSVDREVYMMLLLHGYVSEVSREDA